MNIKRNVAGLFFVAVGGLGLLSACGEITTEESCTFDTDCTGDQVCDQTVCVDTCTSTAECGADEECVERPGEAEGMVCREGEAPGDDCNDADFGECPDGLVCSAVTGECQEPGELPAEYYTVQINDVTDAEAPDRCDDTTYGYNTAGAKIMYVRLETLEGDLVAYGRAVGDEIDTATSDFVDTTIIDGAAPDYAEQCPADEAYFDSDGNDLNSETNFRDDVVVALGCGGSLYVQFFAEGSTQPLILDESYQITVGEFGPTCNDDAQSSPDYYDVFVCTSSAGTVLNSESCADVPINEAALTGISTRGISLPADEN